MKIRFREIIMSRKVNCSGGDFGWAGVVSPLGVRTAATATSPLPGAKNRPPSKGRPGKAKDGEEKVELECAEVTKDRYRKLLDIPQRVAEWVKGGNFLYNGKPCKRVPLPGEGRIREQFEQQVAKVLWKREDLQGFKEAGKLTAAGCALDFAVKIAQETILALEKEFGKEYEGYTELQLWMIDVVGMTLAVGLVRAGKQPSPKS